MSGIGADHERIRGAAEQQQQNDRRYRLDPGIVLPSRSASPPIFPHNRAPVSAASVHTTASEERSSFKEAHIVPNHGDTAEAARIMRTLENTDQMLFHSLSRGISVDELRHELVLKLGGQR